jgi:hypothetical protein
VEVIVRGSLFFVHGTGIWDNRKPGFDGELDHLTGRIQAAMNDSGLADVALHVPQWGRECGPQWPDVALVMSSAARTKSAGGPPELDAGATEVQMWELLAFDPVVERRLLALATPVNGRRFPPLCRPTL